VTITFWTEDKIVKAEKLWKEGLSAREIAVMFGSKKNTVINMASRNRDRFPSRQDAWHPQPKVAAYKMQLLRDAANGSRSARRELAKMFPDNPIIARATRHEEALR